jgi:hypothetical protein
MWETLGGGGSYAYTLPPEPQTARRVAVIGLSEWSRLGLRDAHGAS